MTGDVVLRDVTAEDLSIFFDHQRDREANEMAAFPARDIEAFMTHWMKILDDETVTTKTILFEGQVAGNVVSWEQSGKSKIGYWIGKEYWGKGIATRAVSEFLRLVKARPLHAHVAKRNIGSLRVLEKCGFRISGEDQVPSDAADEWIEEFILTLGTNGGDAAPSQSPPGRTSPPSTAPSKMLRTPLAGCSTRLRRKRLSATARPQRPAPERPLAFTPPNRPGPPEAPAGISKARRTRRRTRSFRR